ncbi:MAG: hypothetical protein R2941_16255 [Desulfobacterales bacterium]
MPEIDCKSLKEHLNTAFPVWLIHGEEMLCNKAFASVLDTLVPPAERSLNYEPVEQDNVPEAIARVNTFSMLSGRKVVALRDSRIFYSGQEDADFLEKARDAHEAKDMKKAAKFFTVFLGSKNISCEDLQGGNRDEILKAAAEQIGDGKWVDELIAYCRDKGLAPSAVQDHMTELQKALEKGFPPGNCLLITTDMADRRRSLYKTIRDLGIIVDCSVPKGSTKADKTAQEAVLNEQMRSVLGESGKTMDSAAYHALCEMTGFALRTFTANLEKLVHYVGERRNITAEDVHAVLKRTRQDPIYELTNALSDRNTEACLFYLSSLISEGLFPLQILAALVNQVRKLLVFKGFTESTPGRAWKSGMSYQQFQTAVVPALLKSDEQMQAQLESWEEMLTGEKEAETGKKKKKSKASTDLLMAKNPKSTYPLYLGLQKADRFTGKELREAMEWLGQADVHLKTGGHNPKLILETVILRICSPQKS